MASRRASARCFHCGGLCGAAEKRGEVGHVALVFVEEAVEADGGVIVG